MKEYPSIDGSSKAPIGKPCIAFYKYDGSNLRWEWQPKKGWCKYGTRTRLFDATDPVFGKAIPLFQDTMATEIERRVKEYRKGVQRITAYTEFFGPNSFAGKHDPADTMELRLFDVFLFQKGSIPPRDFVRTFVGLPGAAEVVYDGPLNRQFITDVQTGAYPVWEGVVAKGTSEDWMVKIKTNAYFTKLNEVYGTKYRQYWE